MSGPADERRPWRRAFAWLAFLAPFFFATYGFATWVTAQRAEVPAIAFGWEQAIPFLPWTIVPYWSIDLLYGLSLLLCRTRRELDVHAKRLLTAQLVAVACFVLVPLRFSFERPVTEGVFGGLFAVLGSFDKPFNQAPSLHIALLVVLWALYARKASGALRVVVDAWFALIGVSVLTTWQHHFIDVPTGALLGFACLWLWPLEVRSPAEAFALTADPVRRRLAGRYAAGAFVAAATAAAFGGAALAFAWVAVSLALVALGYLAVGPDVFQKHAGRLSPAATALLLPYLAGAWINARLWTRGRRGSARVTDDVRIGPLPSLASLEADGIAGIVDLAAEWPVARHGRRYAGFPSLDLVPPGRDALEGAAKAIESLRVRGPVLVCCALGYSRSASAVAAWLVATGRARDADAAIAMVRAARPQAVLEPMHRAALATIAPAVAVDSGP